MANKGILRNRWNAGMEEVDQQLGGAEMEPCKQKPSLQRCSYSEIQMMILPRENQSIRSSREELTNQKWPNSEI
jgi:hypothetical protein